MNSFDIKTKIYFGDQALDRLAEIPYERILLITADRRSILPNPSVNLHFVSIIMEMSD